MFGEGAGNSRGMIPRCMEEVFTQLERRAKVQLTDHASVLIKKYYAIWFGPRTRRTMIHGLILVVSPFATISDNMFVWVLIKHDSIFFLKYRCYFSLSPGQ